MKDKNNKKETNSLKEKKIKRRFLAATLGSLIVVNILSLCDFSVVKLGNSSANLGSEDVTTSIEEVDSETEASFKQLIINSVKNFTAEKISIKDYNLSSTVARQLLQEIVEENPQYFYFDTAGTLMAHNAAYYNETGIEYATAILPVYIDDAQNKAAFVEQIANEIVAGIDDSMNDIEKALYVHDYIVLNYKYDERVRDDPYSAVYDIYGFFEQETGVCQAYTSAFQYIMQYKLGIPTKTAISQAMCHMWNTIQIDGNWYHVDVTFDDPTPDAKDRVSHDHFLVSDDRIAYDSEGEPSHYDWVYTRNQNGDCKDTTYDSHWWRNVSTEIYKMDGEWYSIDNTGNFVARDVESGEIVEEAPSFTVEDDKWYCWNSDWTFWNGNYTKVLRHGNKFFYNLTEDVYIINADGSGKRHIINLPKEEHNGYLIYNMEIDENGTLYAILQNNPQVGFDGTPVMSETIEIGNVDDLAADTSASSDVVTEVNWTEVSSNLEQEGTVEISVAEDNAQLPAEVVESAKGKDVELIINVGSYQWSVNGLDVADSDIADVNLNVSENSGIVPAEITEKYTDGQKTVEVNLAHEGQFGYNANLKVFIGTEYAGKTASILHYEDDNSRLAYQGTTVVDEEGYAVLNLSHASSYMVILDDKPIGLPGDADADGKTALVDYMMFKNYLINNLSADSIKLVNVDMDGDNAITIRDAVLLSKELTK